MPSSSRRRRRAGAGGASHQEHHMGPRGSADPVEPAPHRIHALQRARRGEHPLRPLRNDRSALLEGSGQGHHHQGGSRCHAACSLQQRLLCYVVFFRSLWLLGSLLKKEDYRTFVDGVGPFFIPLKPGVDLLNQLRATGRYRHFVLSNFHRDYFEELRARYNHTEVCFSLFDGLCVSAWHHHIKPEREIYMMLFREFGLNPRECLFIDDSEVNVRAGEEFGMRGVVCRDHDQLKEDLQRLKLL
ncbi:HAD family phosphatase [Balamuthia mandrillaris]